MSSQLTFNKKRKECESTDDTFDDRSLYKQSRFDNTTATELIYKMGNTEQITYELLVQLRKAGYTRIQCYIKN